MPVDPNLPQLQLFLLLLEKFLEGKGPFLKAGIYLDLDIALTLLSFYFLLSN